MRLDLQAFQAEVAKWATEQFGEQPGWQPLLGMVEEVGELAHAHLKEAQGIRGFDDAQKAYAAKLDAIGDILVYLVAYCEREGIDASYAAGVVWATVSKRDWKADPEQGEGPGVPVRHEYATSPSRVPGEDMTTVCLICGKPREHRFHEAYVSPVTPQGVLRAFESKHWALLHQLTFVKEHAGGEVVGIYCDCGERVGRVL